MLTSGKYSAVGKCYVCTYIAKEENNENELG